jgi:hypothetical protein
MVLRRGARDRFILSDRLPFILISAAITPIITAYYCLRSDMQIKINYTAEKNEMALDSGESNVAVGGNGSTMFGGNGSELIVS